MQKLKSHINLHGTPNAEGLFLTGTILVFGLSAFMSTLFWPSP